MPILEYNPNMGEQRYNIPPATNPWVIGGVRFLPGMNQISEVEWDSLNAHPAYQKAIAQRIQMGKLRVVPGPKKDAEPSIADFKLNEAVPMIQNCTDVELLKRWQQEDSRTGSQKAIAEQLKKISIEPVEDTKASSTDSDAPVFS